MDVEVLLCPSNLFMCNHWVISLQSPVTDYLILNAWQGWTIACMHACMIFSRWCSVSFCIYATSSVSCIEMVTPVAMLLFMFLLKANVTCHKRKHIIIIILFLMQYYYRFHSRLCWIHFFVVGFCFQYFPAAHMCISMLGVVFTFMHVCLRILFGRRQQCTAIESQNGGENNTCPFGRVQWLKDTTNLWSQAFAENEIAREGGEGSMQTADWGRNGDKVLLRAALVTAYRRQRVVAITPKRGQEQ